MSDIDTDQDFENLSTEGKIAILKAKLDCLCNQYDKNGDGIIDSQFLPEPQAYDPTLHTNFCGGTLSCLGAGTNGVINVNLLPNASEINGFIQSVLNVFDTDGNGMIDNNFLPPVVIDCSQVLSCLDADGDGVINSQFLPPTSLTITLQNVIDYYDPDGDGLIDPQFLPPQVSSFSCDQVLACLGADADGVIDKEFLPESYVQQIEEPLFFTAGANNNEEGILDLSSSPDFPQDGCGKYALLEICLTADSSDADGNPTGDTVTVIVSTGGQGGSLQDVLTFTHSGDNIEVCHQVWGTVINDSEVPWKVITTGNDATTTVNLTFNTKTIFF